MAGHREARWRPFRPWLGSSYPPGPETGVHGRYQGALSRQHPLPLIAESGGRLLRGAGGRVRRLLAPCNGVENCRGPRVKDDDNSSMSSSAQAAREAMGKTTDELVPWAFERTHDDTLRQSIVRLELERRVTEYTKATSRYMLWSVIVLAASAVITALVTIFSAWLAR